MSKKDQQKAITGRMALAREALMDCLILCGASDKTGRSVVNRAYFATYYAVLGMMATSEAKTQAENEEAMLAAFEKAFVATGRIPNETGETIRKLYDLRMETEWERLGPVGMAEAKEAAEMSGRVYNAISGYLFEKGLLEEMP